MSEMYGSSDKVRLCTADPSPKCTNPSPRASPATQRLGAGPQKARLPRFSPHLEDALVLYTPPEEACSEDIKPKCGTRSMPRAPYPVPPPHPPPPGMSSRVPLRSEREVHVVLDPLLGLKLRPHQREGVTVRFGALPP